MYKQKYISSSFIPTHTHLKAGVLLKGFKPGVYYVGGEVVALCG